MLEDNGKIDWIREDVDKAKSIAKFNYKHASIISIMRTYTEGKELVRPTIIILATNFISLQFVFG
jgi:hypothetical protein